MLRSRSNRVIGGVCAGLAAYLGLDARLVRIVWVIASLSTVGLGVMLYILALIVIPEAPAEEAVTPSNSTVI
ncbi:MAG: PspC domain-containing protein [Anaerolineae bacterium]